MDMRSSIEDTRKGFEASFATGDFYNRQTQDSQHLEKILQFLQVSEFLIWDVEADIWHSRWQRIIRTLK